MPPLSAPRPPLHKQVRDAVTVTETVAAADNAAAVTGIIVGNGTGGRDPGLTRDQLIKGACLGGALFRGDLRGTERLTRGLAWQIRRVT